MKITKTSLLTIIFGTVMSQAGWLVVGFAFMRLVYVDQLHFIPESQIAPLKFHVLLSAIFLGAGIAKGRAIAQALEREKIVRGRLVKVEGDNSGEDTIYRMTFTCIDSHGPQRSLTIERHRNNLALGEEFAILIDEKTGEGMLEIDLPGGTTFASFKGTQPIDPKVFLRILVIPILALAPLLGLAPSIAMTFQRLGNSTEMWLVCGWSVVIQIIWLFANRRHFTFKSTHIGCGCVNQSGSDEVCPAHPAGGRQ